MQICNARIKSEILHLKVSPYSSTASTKTGRQSKRDNVTLADFRSL